MGNNNGEKGPWEYADAELPEVEEGTAGSKGKWG